MGLKYWSGLKFKEYPNRVFFIGDMHFSDERVALKRGYDSAEDMRHQLIDNWNSVVGAKDTVFVLGDFDLGSMFSVKENAKLLNGRKILIRGNHDKFDDSVYLRSGFIEVHKTLNIDFGSDKYFLIHNPEWKPEDNVDSLFQLYAHLHNEHEIAELDGKGICLSAERPFVNEFPVSLKKIREFFKSEVII